MTLTGVLNANVHIKNKNLRITMFSLATITCSLQDRYGTPLFSSDVEYDAVLGIVMSCNSPVEVFFLTCHKGFCFCKIAFLGLLGHVISVSSSSHPPQTIFVWPGVAILGLISDLNIFFY